MGIHGRHVPETVIKPPVQSLQSLIVAVCLETLVSVVSLANPGLSDSI